MFCTLKKSTEVSSYYNVEFKTFLDSNQNRFFKILDEDDHAVKLAKVNFWISKDCIVLDKTSEKL